MTTDIDLEGKQLGRFHVLRRGRYDHRGLPSWECVCDCGKRYTAPTDPANPSTIVSCSCRGFRLPFTKPHTLHGMSATPEYRHWTTIIQRCHNKRHRDYPRYGGMGITVCTRWRESFIAFIRDVGPRTYPRSGIVLIDRAGHYEPGNARWAVTRAPHGMRGLLGEISESYLAVRADRHTSRRKSSCDHEHDAESACKTGVLCNLPEAAAAHRNAQGTHRPRNAGTPM